MEVEKQEGTRGWHKLPVEIQDFILHKVVELASEQVSCLMDLVLPFVCSTWRERRTFWKNKHVTGQMEKNTVCNAAATLGSIPLMEWLISLGYSMTTQHCSSAARAGHLEFLKWAKEKGCGGEQSTCASAAEGNQLEVLKWLRENDVPWDSYTCSHAAKAGNFEVLKWARENGVPSIGMPVITLQEEVI